MMDFKNKNNGMVVTNSPKWISYCKFENKDKCRKVKLKTDHLHPLFTNFFKPNLKSKIYYSIRLMYIYCLLKKEREGHNNIYFI